MQSFTITPTITIAAEWKKTRSAFKHEAVLLRNGVELERTKICYQNRTWERFRYDSVIERLVERSSVLATPKAKRHALAQVLKQNEEQSASTFRAVAMVAAIGDVLQPDKASRNDWKRRMISAGLGSSGVSFPDDWATLSEDEKTRRLDGAIAELKK